jgi:aspartokinase/homoserine dehydrogenase 1
MSLSFEEHLGFDGRKWQVHKFGGTSVADASCFLKAASIVEEQLGVGLESDSNDGATYPSSPSNLAVVVSAMGGKPKVTDLLLDAVTAAANRDENGVNSKLETILTKHFNCLDTLKIESQQLKENLQNDISDIRDILKTVALMKWKATRISELVSGYGETWSAQILSALLSARSAQRQSSAGGGITHYYRYLDARRVITIDEDAIQDGAMCWEISSEKLKQVYKDEYAATFNNGINDKQGMMHFVITGYVASNTDGVATTLQRDGSDYSAAIMGRLLVATNITIWTDVDGVLSADPRRVPDSYVLPEVSFNEAMELAYFGAKVIHPKTMQPAIMGFPQIPIFIRNTFNSSFRGSRIFTSSTTHTDRDRCVCGFSSIENMAIINVEGSGMVGVKGVARRLFGTLETTGVNVVLISQASSEHSITFATSMQHAETAKRAIEEEFHKEIKQNHISAIDVVSPCSIIAAVGDGMHLTTGVAGRFFSALGDAKISVLAISQGSSERNISAVVLESESTRALRAIHAAFRLSHTNVRVGIVGMSEVGESLLKLLNAQRQKFKSAFEIDLQVCAVLKDSKSPDIVVLVNNIGGVDADSITVSEYNEQTGGSFLLGAPASAATFVTSKSVATKLEPGGLDELARHVFSEDCAHSIIFDCTGDERVGAKHDDWLGTGINIVTANSTGLSGTKSLREAIKKAERAKKVHYLREVTVGGGLPVLSTLRDLLSSGDHARRIDGILSVSMSYIMHRIAPPPGVSDCSAYDERSTLGAYRDDKSMSPAANQTKACSFNQAVKEAIALGLMEEDPIKDLNNEYTARSLMVLAHELGLDGAYDVSKIQSQSDSLVSDSVDYSEIETHLDAKMTERVATAAANGCVPRHTFSIDVNRGTIAINIVDVPCNHIFATTPPGCACVRFFTDRHRTYPLIVQGPSAGADSTASALLAEVLNMIKQKVGSKSGVISRSASASPF